MNLKNLVKRTLAVGALSLLAHSQAFAVPLLQLYIEGGTYDTVTETWVTTASTFELWVIGNVGGAGGKGTLSGVDDTDTDTAAGVTLVSTVLGGGAALSFTSTTAAVAGITDVSAADAVVVGGRSGTASHPDLASHGIFTGSNGWQEWDLGNFDETGDSLWDAMDTSAGAAVSGALPSVLPLGAQINVYTVTLTGDFDAVHFDGFGYYDGKTGEKFTFVPFSHDGAESHQVPEPMSLMLLGAGLLGLAGRARRHS